MSSLNRLSSLLCKSSIVVQTTVYVLPVVHRAHNSSSLWVHLLVRGSHRLSSRLWHSNAGLFSKLYDGTVSQAELSHRCNLTVLVQLIVKLAGSVRYVPRLKLATWRQELIHQACINVKHVALYSRNSGYNYCMCQSDSKYWTQLPATGHRINIYPTDYPNYTAPTKPDDRNFITRQLFSNMYWTLEHCRLAVRFSFYKFYVCFYTPTVTLCSTENKVLIDWLIDWAINNCSRFDLARWKSPFNRAI